MDNKTKKELLINMLVNMGYIREPLEKCTYEEVKAQASYEGIINYFD